MMRILTLVTILNLISFAQDIKVPPIDFAPKKYVCYISPAPLNIDGKLDEEQWNDAAWTDAFVDIEGNTRPAPRFTTRAKMLWDSNYFYVAAQLIEPDIWGTLKNRDDIIFFDNDFEIFIDPDGDTHSYCEFEMNALNTVWDLLLIAPYRDMDKAPLHDWDIKGLKTGAAVYGSLNKPGDKDSCWTVEVAFPWSAFNQVSKTEVPPRDGDQWRVNFSRVEWKTEVKEGKYRKVINPETGRPYPEDNWVWSPQGVVNMHYPEMWGYVQFSSKSHSKNQSFIRKPVEQAKWLLRMVYYKEKIHYNETGKYTSDFKKLNIKSDGVPGYSFPPIIENTSSLFEASVISEDHKTKLTINNTGLITSSVVDNKK